MALEQHKKDQLKQKVLEAKRMRDEMIKDAHKRKIEAEKAAKAHEQELVSKLQNEIQQEKLMTQKKRDEEREYAKRVILENELEKKRRQQAQSEMK